MRRLSASASAVVLWLGVSLGPSLALAAGGQQSALAEQLFRDARSLMQLGRHEAALEKLQASQELDPSLGTLLNLADCLEQLGRTASAWGKFAEAEQGAKLAGDEVRERVAAERVRRLEPQLQRLKLVLPSGLDADRLTVSLDAVRVGSVVLGTAMPLDPGEHRILVTAADREDWQTTVFLNSPGQTVEVAIPELRAASSGSPTGTGDSGSELPPPVPSLAESVKSRAASAVAPESQEPPPSGRTLAGAPDRERGTSPGTATLLLGGASVIALGLGTGYGIAAWSAWSDAKDRGCDGGVCPNDAAQERSAAAGSRADVATGAYVAGGALAAAATLVYLLVDRRKEASHPHQARSSFSAEAAKNGAVAAWRYAF